MTTMPCYGCSLCSLSILLFDFITKKEKPHKRCEELNNRFKNKGEDL